MGIYSTIQYLSHAKNKGGEATKWLPIKYFWQKQSSIYKSQFYCLFVQCVDHCVFSLYKSHSLMTLPLKTTKLSHAKIKTWFDLSPPFLKIYLQKPPRETQIQGVIFTPYPCLSFETVLTWGLRARGNRMGGSDCNNMVRDPYSSRWIV